MYGSPSYYDWTEKLLWLLIMRVLIGEYFYRGFTIGWQSFTFYMKNEANSMPLCLVLKFISRIVLFIKIEKNCLWLIIQ